MFLLNIKKMYIGLHIITVNIVFFDRRLCKGIQLLLKSHKSLLEVNDKLISVEIYLYFSNTLEYSERRLDLDCYDT